MKKELVLKVKKLAASPKAAIIAKIAAVLTVAIVAAVAFSGTAFAATDPSGADFTGVTTPIVGLINSFVNPLLAIVGAGGTIFCIFLGVKFATAEEPQEKEKRKQALKTAIIGFFLIFILMVALKLSIKPMTDWMDKSTKGANTTIQVTTEATTNP